MGSIDRMVRHPVVIDTKAACPAATPNASHNAHKQTQPTLRVADSTHLGAASSSPPRGRTNREGSGPGFECGRRLLSACGSSASARPRTARRRSRRSRRRNPWKPHCQCWSALRRHASPLQHGCGDRPARRPDACGGGGSSADDAPPRAQVDVSFGVVSKQTLLREQKRGRGGCVEKERQGERVRRGGSEGGFDRGLHGGAVGLRHW